MTYPSVETALQALEETNNNLVDQVKGLQTRADAAVSQSETYRDEAKAHLDNTAEVSGLDTVDEAVDLAIPQAPALLNGLRRSVEAASGGRMSVFYTAKTSPVILCASQNSTAKTWRQVARLAPVYTKPLNSATTTTRKYGWALTKAQC